MPLCGRLLGYTGIAASVLMSVPLWAADWSIKPRLSVIETYTDNLRLAPEGQEEHDTITQLNPGLSVDADGRRVKLNANYNMQNVIYSDHSSRNRTHNQFSGDLQSELIKDWFYLDWHGSISQQLVAPQKGVSTDNLNIVPGSRGNVITTSVAPRIQRNLGRDMSLGLAYTEGRVYYDGNGPSDTDTRDLSFSFERSRNAGLDWRLQANDQKTNRRNANDFESRSAQGRIGFPVLPDTRFVGYVGYEDGNVSSSRTFKSGNYWSAGIFWQPSPKLSLELTRGDKDKQGRLSYAPTSRTSLSASYVARDVGVRPSSTWIADINHHTRHSVWSLSYSEQLSSDAILAVTGVIPQVLTINGQPVFDQQQQPIIAYVPQLEIVSEEFVRASTTAGVSYSTAKSNVNLRLTDETRDYELTKRHAESRSAYLGLNWRFASRTALDYSHNQTITNDASFGEYKTKVDTVTINRHVSQSTTTQLSWRRAKVDQLSLSNNYNETRISASLTTTF
jgi:hypothetical protein